MKRLVLEKLKKWKNRPGHKPLIIQGIRQVGKTWLMQEFGRLQYKNVAYIWFENNERMETLFSGDMDTDRLMLGLEAETRQKIIPGETLIIFDEIQACPNALTSLKYFNENMPQYDIVAAGSLLGVFLHEGVSFPVGKVEFMKLYPMCFFEFLYAMGEEQLCGLLEKCDWEMIEVFKEKYISYLRMYFYIGGMPEAVHVFAANKDFSAVRNVQNQILQSYSEDFSKHIPKTDIQKTVQIWNSIPYQLAKENKKFAYSEIQKGGRARVFELALEWLIRSGLIHRVSCVSKPAMPLKGYANSSGAFKLFLCDIGLMSAMSKVDVRALLEGDALFKEFKGALTEQFVCQELKLTEDIELAYWANDPPARAEIDFIFQSGMEIIPIEVKSSTNLKAKSLAVYREKFQPKTEIRTSLADYKKSGNLFDIPLYALGKLNEILDLPSF
ncbi:MAG: AAA family ATPase [Treponema sp.]|jgi:predicted AAA+ superfamily ATPase|nr:AAA family ATPase [Treponema sp.]